MINIHKISAQNINQKGKTMKRILSLILTLIMISSCLIVTAGATDAPSYTVSSRIDLKKLGDYATHGNHQTRTVHTSHGDYAAYITGTYTDDRGQTVNKWSLMKIDVESGSYTTIFTGEKYFDSSQVSLLVDKDENVWAITSTSDSKRNLTTEGFDCRAHRLDAVTGEVTSYTRIISGGAQDGYGYATCYYDEAFDRIIVMHAGGDYVEGKKKASFNWTIFDLKKNQWQARVRYAMLDSRHCYMFGFADGKGGLIMIAQRDIKAASLGYPEVGSNEGITSSDWQYMSQHGITRWAADYCWDQLDLYYFPKITESKYTKYTVCEADYSKVLGTQAQRNTLEYRLKNYYPAIQNNNGGDFLLTKTAEGRLLLHITYNKALIQAAMDRSKGSESKWYHQVWDVTDGADYCAKLYDGVLVDEMAGESGFGFRLYEDTEGNVNIIQTHNGALTILRAEYDGVGGYNYYQVGDTVTVSGAANLVNISSHRGGSITDNKFNILYSVSSKYAITQVTLSPVAYEPIQCQHVWEISESECFSPTCAGPGYNIYRCTYCNVSQREDLSATGHFFEVTSGQAPTCTEDGSFKYTCTVCSRTKTETLYATGHSIVPLSVNPATCTEDGFEVWYCENGCGHTEKTTLPATGHSYEDGSCTECGGADPDRVPEYEAGDVNGDGAVNAKDVNTMKRFLSGAAAPSEAERASADVNLDGAFNTLDANALIRLVAGT